MTDASTILCDESHTAGSVAAQMILLQFHEPAICIGE